MSSSAKALAFTLLIALAGCGKGKPEAPQGKAEGTGGPLAARTVAEAAERGAAGKPAPTDRFEGADRTPTTLAAFRGKPLLVNLWATWCAPCLKEMPALDRLARRTHGRLQVLIVSQDMGGWHAVDPYVARAGLTTLKPALDKENNLALALGVAGLPATVLYDAAGREVWRVNGPARWDEPGAERALGL
jgi:thiol-disulfide isomerase/thioredoxin